MLWNEITIDMMIMFYVVGLFTLILVCLYALIQSKANKLYTFTIIPLALIIASMTWQGIKMLQGMPVHGLPYDQQVQVMFVHDSKPWIYALLNSEDGPKFYKIEWNEENKEKMKQLQQTIGTGFAEGEFKEGNTGESDSFFFTPMLNMSEPDRKDPDEEDRTPVSIDSSGVTYTSQSPSGGGPGSTSTRGYEHEYEDDNGVSYTRNPEIEHEGWSTLLLFTETEVREPLIGPLNEGEE